MLIDYFPYAIPVHRQKASIGAAHFHVENSMTMLRAMLRTPGYPWYYYVVARLDIAWLHVRHWK